MSSTDERITKARQFSEYRSTLSNQISQLKLKTATKLRHSVNGGTFIITPTLISFVDVLVREGQEEAVLFDHAETPILIADLAEFKSTILEKYTLASMAAHVEHQGIRKARSVGALIDD